jgi:hypothetical protein
MAKRPQPKPTISPPAPFEQNTDTTTETEAIETPDIAAFRAFAPDTTMLSSTLSKRFGDRRQEIKDSYGAYTGIPSQVARNEMRDAALAEVDEAEGLALAEGSERAQALKLAQLEALANMTGRTRSKSTGKNAGYNTSVLQPQQSTFWPSLVGGLLGGASLALGARQPSVPKPPTPTYFPSSRTWP